MTGAHRAIAAAAWVALGCGSAGANPHPVHLIRPAAHPLSATAQLGRAIFFDPALSGSGKLSCASCHAPAYAFGPPNALSVQLGGVDGAEQGARAVPSLRYIERVPGFSIGPDDPEAEGRAGARGVPVTAGPTVAKLAGTGGTRSVPQGGLFWDGRASTLEAQAIVPLLDPAEMAAVSVAAVAVKLRQAPYAATFSQLFGQGAVEHPERLVDEAMFAVGRYELEDPAFHPYDSKYDAWLEGKARLTPAELRGLRVFEDTARGNCAGCHLDRPGTDGRPPTFSDYQYEALGVPRNRTLRRDQDPRYFDLGLCGPVRTDLVASTAYCGMFRTPSLRNVATRAVFFHNGVYHSLERVLAFYAFRDARPDSVYPTGAHGLAKFDDLPGRFHANVDVRDPPFDRHAGDPPPLSARDIQDLIAFLGTLTDGYPPGP